MMFYSEALRVVLATVHIPLAEVPRALTREPLEATIDADRARAAALRLSARRGSRVAGLNPHAGEHGLIGREEDEVLAPAIAACRARGIDVDGPFPGRHGLRARDARRVRRGDRLLSRPGADPGEAGRVRPAVNVTLGLPIVRTSVDHGTAFDIAGQGVADPSSMIEAVLLAARLAGDVASGSAGTRGCEAIGRVPRRLNHDS